MLAVKKKKEEQGGLRILTERSHRQDTKTVVMQAG